MSDPINHSKKQFLRWSVATGALALGVVVCFVWLRLEHPKNHYSEDQIVPFLTATELELFSVHPSQLEYGNDPFAPDAPEPKPLKTPFGEFHGYPVLGVCKITAQAELDVVRKAVHSLDAAGRNWQEAYAMCFSPRHGVRIRAGGTTCDLLICYKCSEVQIFRGETLEGKIYFASTSSTPLPAPEDLNGILTSHAIALPKERKH